MKLTREELQTIIRDSIMAARKQEPVCLTVVECAKYTNIGTDKIRELIAKDGTDFPFFKVGVKALINKDMLDRWLEKAVAEKKQL